MKLYMYVCTAIMGNCLQTTSSQDPKEVYIKYTRSYSAHACIAVGIIGV